MCEQSSEWLCSWERDAQGRKLSVIVNLDTSFPLAAGRECDLLRPVFIDGPSIGEFYDEEYRLKNHKGQHSQQNAASWPLHKFRPFPVMALCQTLFTFIARGHKTVALLPGIYDERTPDGMFGNDVSHVVDNVRMLRKLVKMHLVQFKKDFTNFEVSVRIKARKANGALVTGHFIPDLDKPKKSAEEGRRSANESKKNKKQPSLGPSSEIKNYHTTFLHSLPPNYVPIIKPFFFTMRKERRMSVPLDSPCFQGVLPTVGELLVFPTKVDSDQAVSELAKHWQLTLFAQYRLLEELNALLNGHYPGGNREKNVWQMVKELWEESREVRREAEDPLHELEDRAIFNGDIGEVRTSLLALSIYE